MGTALKALIRFLSILRLSGFGIPWNFAKELLISDASCNACAMLSIPLNISDES